MLAEQGLPQEAADAPTEKSLALEDLRRAIAVLNAIVDDRAILTRVPEEDRKALLMAAGRVSRPENSQERRLVREFRRDRRRKIQAQDREAKASTEIRAARQAPVFVAPLPTALPNGEAEALNDGPELQKPKNCYVCKTDYRRLHFFYDSMCPECAALNYQKRFQTAELAGRVAVITGARLKIGYQAALLLLRAGVRVIVTTRFPHDAARRYARERDYAAWSNRLQIFGLDLRHSPSVEIFCRYLDRTLDRLDFLINNAAQTVRRPIGFYSHLLEYEAAPFEALETDVQSLLRAHEACKSALASAPTLGTKVGTGLDATGLAVLNGGTGGVAGGTGVGLRASAALSQLKYTYEDGECGKDVFPTGQTDADLQQVDLRLQNSWRMTLADVSTPEMLEVQLVNAVAPFVLCSKLKGLMLRSPAEWKHIVNVTAMEGIFSRGTKTDKHPHTNMAKAALNMMTLTSARDYARDGIYMNAVDTGWVTDEDPAAIAARKREEHDFQPPLDIVDGAARIVDPIFESALRGEHIWGKFLKDYKPANW